MSGLAIEAATSRVEVVVCGSDGTQLGEVREEVGHEHTRRLANLIGGVLKSAHIRPADLAWVAADLGPGSFTGVRVGLATAQALTMVGGGTLCGASSLAALALSTPARRALVVPLVTAGKRDLYAGFFRASPHGAISLLAAPQVGTPNEIRSHVEAVRVLLGHPATWLVGPGVARDRAFWEEAYPGSTQSAWRHDGLSAIDLAHAACAGRGPAAGLPVPGDGVRPLYVRPAQAEERVRHQAHGAVPTVLRNLAVADVTAVAEIERRVFSDPWSEPFFLGELDSPMVYARIAEREGRLVGYSLAWLGGESGHLGNLAVVPEMRRRGVALALLDDLLGRARATGVRSLTLEVRVSNFVAQWLYRARGFRLAGLRRQYYRDTGEDALVMEWRPSGRPE